MEGVSKQFGGAVALDNVSIQAAEGEVLALCGANGAGKSTLMRILAGVERADAGHVFLDGREVRIDRPRTATDLGLAFVHQELNLVPKFTGLQNLALGQSSGGALGLLDRRKIRARANVVSDLLGHRLLLDVPVDQLPVAEKWMISLGRGLMKPARLIALDEPTASFTPEEAERLYGVIEQLVAAKVAVIYISHRLDEVLMVADRVCVLRNGRVAGDYEARSLDSRSLTTHIVGREVESLERRGPVAPRSQAVRLSVRGLSRPPVVRDVTFDLHQGEILGVAGLVGSGRTEIARLLAGADLATDGHLELNKRPYQPTTPNEAVRRGVCLVPEERRRQGLVLTDSVEANLQMTELGARRHLTSPLRPGRARRRAKRLMEELAIKCGSLKTPVQQLSGGNQQKVVIGKCVHIGPQVLILDEPTVGVDVGARAEIYKIIDELATAGTAVLVISSDFDELAICHRVLVVRDGTVVAEVDREHATKERLTRLCYGHDDVHDQHTPSQETA